MSNLHVSKFLVQIIATNQEVRSNNLINKLNSLEIPFSFSSSVFLSESDFDKEIFHDEKISQLISLRPLSAGEIGCAVAHKRAIENFLTSSKEFGLIFEDDAEISNYFDFESLTEVLSSQQPTIINCGWLPGFAVAEAIDKSENPKIVKTITPSTCAWAYAFNRQAAKLLLNNNEVIIDGPDYPVNTFLTTSYWVTNPSWVTTDLSIDKSVIGFRAPSMLNYRPWRHKLKIFLSVSMLLRLIFSGKLNLTFRQILSRVVLRDLFYKYARKTLLYKNPSKYILGEIVVVPIFLTKIIKLLKLN